MDEKTVWTRVNLGASTFYLEIWTTTKVYLIQNSNVICFLPNFLSSSHISHAWTWQKETLDLSLYFPREWMLIYLHFKVKIFLQCIFQYLCSSNVTIWLLGIPMMLLKDKSRNIKNSFLARCLWTSGWNKKYALSRFPNKMCQRPNWLLFKQFSCPLSKLIVDFQEMWLCSNVQCSFSCHSLV